MSVRRPDSMARVCADPILCFDEIIADLNCSKATFHRGPRHEMPIVQISARRLGVKKSDYDAWKSKKTQAPARAA